MYAEQNKNNSILKRRKIKGNWEMHNEWAE